MLPRIAGVGFLLALALPALADTRSFLGYRFACSAGYAGATVTRSSEVIYYAYSGDPTKARDYTVCVNAGGAFSSVRHGSALNNIREPCATFPVGSFTLACRGGSMSTAALSVALHQMQNGEGKNVKPFTLQNDTLYYPLYADYRLVQIVGFQPLPRGYGVAADWNNLYAGTISINWDSTRDIPLMPAVGAAPSIEPRVEPASLWVAMLGAVFPFGQLVLAACVLAYARAAYAGFARGLGNPDEGRKLFLLGLSAFALLGLALSGIPAGLPESALQQAKQQFDASRSQAAAIERDRTALVNIVRSQNGTIGPISQSDFQRINVLTQPHRIDPVAQPAPNPEFWAFVAILPMLILFAAYPRRVVRGYDWLSRPHAAEPILKPSLKTGSAIDAHKLADALAPDPRDLSFNTPAFRHAHDAEKARALKEKLEAEAQLAEAAVRREQKRADLKRKRAELTRLERELGEES